MPGLHRAAAVSVPSVLMAAFHLASSDILLLPGLQGDTSGPGCGPCGEGCRWLVLKHNYLGFFFADLVKISVVAVGQTLQS